jgi:hypothetical protein
LRGLADGKHLDAIGTGGEGMKIFDGILVVCEVKIVSRSMSQYRRGSGYLR